MVTAGPYRQLCGGGALRNRRGVRAGERAAAEAKIEAGIQAALVSWEGISTKIGASA